MKLQIDSTDQLIYENEILQLTVVGGIKLEGLDRMRSTLKVQLQQSRRPPVRHNLDLYNDTQLEKFIRKCAERLEIGTSIISASLGELTEELEKYRLQEIKNREENLKPRFKKNIDLFNDNHVEKLVRKTAEHVEIGTSIVRRTFYELTI